MKTIIQGENWFTPFQRGNKNAFQKVFDLYYKSILYFAIKIIQDEGYAEDFVSETFNKAWQNRTKFETPRHLENFLYLVTRNRCISFLRSDKNQRSSTTELIESMTEAEPGHPIDLERAKTELIALLHKKLDELPHGNVLRMSYLEGKSTQEIAEEMGVTENTIYIIKSRSLKLLRGMLSKEDWILFVILFMDAFR